MNSTEIRRVVGPICFAGILLAILYCGASLPWLRHWIRHDWIYVFCVAQVIVAGAWLVFGPGRAKLRIPMLFAWGVASIYTLSTNNLILLFGRFSIASGVILYSVSLLVAISTFGAYYVATGAAVILGSDNRYQDSKKGHQIGLPWLFFVTALCAISATLARGALNGRSNPFVDADILCLHAWIAFFPALAATPAMLFILTPSKKVFVIGVSFFVIAVLVEPVAYSITAPILLSPQFLGSQQLSWSNLVAAWWDALLLDAQALVAVITYTTIARLAGLRMIYPDQSNDNKPKPSGNPATDAGCVQD